MLKYLLYGRVCVQQSSVIPVPLSILRLTTLILLLILLTLNHRVSGI